MTLLGVFNEFFKMVENQFQLKNCLFHSDNGKEYFNEYLGNVLKKKEFYINLPATPLNKMALPKEKTYIYLKWLVP